VAFVAAFSAFTSCMLLTLTCCCCSCSCRCRCCCYFAI